MRIPQLAPSLLVAASLGVVTPALAVPPVNTSWPGNLAIRGYDPVAYATDGRPVKGSVAHAYRWQGAEYRFASAEHLSLFRANPETYAPQYGGYCAWAVSQGYTANIDPPPGRS